MERLSRVLLVFLAIHCSFAFAQNSADTIFYGGPIVTVNARNQEVQALAIQDGKIVAVGTKAAVLKNWQSDTTKVIDLKGQTLMPGFVEPHVHIVLTAMTERLWVNLSNFTLPDDTTATLGKKLKAQLKDAKGKLTGKLVEPPAYLPFQAKMPPPTEAQLIQALQKTTKSMAATGITTASDMSVGANLGVDQEVALYKALTANEGASIRIRGYLYAAAMPKGFDSVKPNEGDDRLRFIGVKFISDGSTQGLTAALTEPYIYPKGSKFSGDLNYKNEDLFDLMKPYFDQGWQISIHSNGDRAIGQTLDNYARLLKGNPHPETRRLRIEHFTINTPEEVRKAVKLGVIPSFTIGHVDYWGEAFHGRLIGAGRSDRIDPAAEVKKQGSRFTLHSDSPVSPYGPLKYISQSVTRLWQLPPRKVLGPDQRVTVDDAIRAVTINAAYQILSDDKIGSLEVGKQADLVILDQNPRTTAPEKIADIQVLETWIDGKWQAW